MIKGMGIDIVQVNRVSQRLGEKVLSPGEEFITPQHFAGLWAVKEAVLKAFGCGVSDISFKDITVVYSDLGAPRVVVSTRAREKMKALNADNLQISISHEKDYAVAVAVIE